MKHAKRSSPAEVTSLGSRLSPIHSARVGVVSGVSPEGRPLVDFEGNRTGALAAVTTLPLSPAQWEQAAGRRQGAVLLFDGGDPLRPILIGLVENGSGCALAPPAGSAPLLRAERAVEGRLPAVPEHAVVDGKRVTIEGQDEIVLRCGDASITLRRNGKVTIRGTFLDSHSTGTNRVKGAAVRIN